MTAGVNRPGSDAHEPKRRRTVILASGDGTNLQALIRATATPGFPARIVLVIADRPGIRALERAKAAGIATALIDHRAYPNRTTFDAALEHTLAGAACEIVCLAGFMRILTPGFVTRWHGRMLNIHPSLLPAFRGLRTHERALAAGVRIHGCTVHLVTPDLDSGPILVQAAVPVLAGDTPESLALRVLEQEHRIFPLALRLLAEDHITVSERTAQVPEGDTPAPLIHPLPPQRLG